MSTNEASVGHAAASQLDRYDSIRSFTLKLAAPLSAEDCALQSMPDASPTRWHLAHTTWFFETFVLARAEPGVRPFSEEFSYLFNSYYNTVGAQFPRPQRGLISRPSLDEVRRYRESVDERMLALLADPPSDSDLAHAIEVGLNHEQQHQELILTDIKYLFSLNPAAPRYRERSTAGGVRTGAPGASDPSDAEWIAFGGGVHAIGIDDARGVRAAFCYDNESPRHRVFLEPFELADRLVTNAEFLEFIDAGGYRRPEYWLSLGWQHAVAGAWTAPLYWRRESEAWARFTLDGVQPLDLDAPVCHVSYFEADAFARWRGVRLPTEAEWEHAALGVPVAGNLVESERLDPTAAVPATAAASTARQMFGDVWEWTSSAYAPYPGYVPWTGALGEYNGKFMCNQYVLRGGSCATPASHIRRTYRNFFPPEARWQFSGLRLARAAH